MAYMLHGSASCQDDVCKVRARQVGELHEGVLAQGAMFGGAP
jgi:hypothetical protein